MKIAYVCADPGVPVFGNKGCSIHVQEIIRAFLRQGATVDLFAHELGGEAPDDLNRLVVYRPPLLPRDVDAASRERCLLKNNHYFNEALRARGPYDLVYERYSLWSYAGMEYARRASTPGILEVNAPLITEQERHRQLVNREAADRVARRVFDEAHSLLAVSRGVAEYLYDHVQDRDRIHIVPNGVDPGRFPSHLKPTADFRSKKFTIGFVGTLKAWHGLHTLIRAFDLFHRLVPASRLLIVGDGPERISLLAEVTTRHLEDSVCFSGSLKPDRVPGALAAMDVAVAPYPEDEHFYFSPLKVYEYMAAGLPVIASQVGQLVDLIEHGSNGFLSAPGDSKALSDLLLKLHGDADLRARLGQEARKTVLSHFTWPSVGRRILSLAANTSNTKYNREVDNRAIGHGTSA